MTEFNTTLLREKFVIRDPSPFSDEEPVTAMSNRISVPLIDRHTGEIVETFIVRAQNMHNCVRMAAKLCLDFVEHGPILLRRQPFDWDLAWHDVIDGYEKKHNPKRWVAVYYQGKLVFAQGDHHAFFDIIERCDEKNDSDYEKSMEIAQEAFHQAGKLVNIDHDTNVAMVMNVVPERCRCGIIVRGADRTTTFNFTAVEKGERNVRASRCLTFAAAFLEGIQLAFSVGMGKEKYRLRMISDSDESEKIYAGEKRLESLKVALAQFEQLYDVSYRPERPNFNRMVEESIAVARNILIPLKRKGTETEDMTD